MVSSRDHVQTSNAVSTEVHAQDPWTKAYTKFLGTARIPVGQLLQYGHALALRIHGLGRASASQLLQAVVALPTYSCPLVQKCTDHQQLRGQIKGRCELADLAPSVVQEGQQRRPAELQKPLLQQ